MRREGDNAVLTLYTHEGSVGRYSALALVSMREKERCDSGGKETAYELVGRNMVQSCDPITEFL